ncbi:MAG: hypothetical protein QNJ97_27210 [Myxococcota bacterium]|nr:hypothetical protein [Myxococcota bacterium]
MAFIPKRLRKSLPGELRRNLGKVFRKPAQQKESWIDERSLQPNHLNMLILRLPK